MPLSSITLSSFFDQWMALAASLAGMAAVLVVPGLVLGFLLNILSFRTLIARTQLCLGILLSFVVTPITLYWIVWLGGFATAFALYAGVWITALFLAWRHRAALRNSVSQLLSQKGLMLFVILWTGIAGLSEIDFLIPAGVQRSLNTMDAVAHVAFTDALTRTGIPPVNPFTYPGSPLHLFYYYLWYLVSSVVDQLGGSLVTARSAVQAVAIFTGFGLAALATAFLDLFEQKVLPGAPVARRWVMLLFTVTGLDLLAWLFLGLIKNLTGKGPGAGLSIEWWNEQVTAWMGAVLMSPHHPAGAVLCLTGALLLIGCMEVSRTRDRVFLTALAALAFASAAGVSLYVTFAFAAGLGLFAGASLIRGEGRQLGPLMAAGIGAAILYAPLALELRAASQDPPSFPLALTIREFTPVDYWVPSVIPFLKTSPASVYALRFLFLPLNLFLELGFFAVAGFLYWRWRKKLARPLWTGEVLLACLAAGSILVCCFLRSTFRWNDLGWRGFLPAQFILLLWSAPVLQQMWRNRSATRILPLLLLVVGCLGTLVELGNFRFRFDGIHGPRTLALRDAYTWIDQNTPRNAVLLFNPDIDIDYFDSLYGFRQAVSAGQAYGAYFSVGLRGEAAFRDALQFFSQDQTLEQLRQFCSKYQVGAIVVSDADPIWKNASSWAWTQQPVYQNASVRVFRAPR